MAKKNNEYGYNVITDSNNILDSYDAGDKNSIIYDSIKEDKVVNADKKEAKPKIIFGIPLIENPYDTEKCICQTGIDENVFKKGLNIDYNELFFHKNMTDFPNTKNTPISVFITELLKCFDKHQINNCRRKAHFLAQTWLETDGFRTLQEYASGLAYEPNARPDARANGNTTKGDGPKFKGRGCMQLTWKNNYKKYKLYLDNLNSGNLYDVVTDPYSVTGDLFLATDSAGWFWNFGKVKKDGTVIDLNLLADDLNTDRISVLVNGGGNGKKERNILTKNLLNFFNYQICVNYP